jgi:hypothetical protein
MTDELTPCPTAVAAASRSYAVLFREFRPLAQLLLAPLAATGLVIYASLWAYVSELIAFISSGDARAASVALGALAAGIFLCVFFVAIAVSSVIDLILRKRQVRGWIHLHPARQDWRLYAAYLRFLLVLSGYFSAVYLVCVLALPALGAGRTTVGIVSVSAAIAGFYILFARIGFLIPGIVAGSTGTVLRKALHEGSGNFCRNLVLAVLLSVPGLVVQSAGEVLFKAGTGSIRGVKLDLPIMLYARALETRLPEFALLFSLSGFVTLALFTAGSVLCYRDRLFVPTPPPAVPEPVANPDSVPV